MSRAGASSRHTWVAWAVVEPAARFADVCSVARRQGRPSSRTRFRGFPSDGKPADVQHAAEPDDSPVSTSDLDARGRPRRIGDVPQLAPRTEGERTEREALQSFYSEREASRRGERGQEIACDRSPLTATNDAFSPWAWEQARESDAGSWALVVDERVHAALRTAPTLIFSPLTYAGAFRRVQALLVAGRDPIDGTGRLTQLEYFCLRRDLRREGVDAYSRSRHWRERSAAQRAVRAACERCGLLADNGHGILLDAHHLHYACVGAERCEVDLLTLCRWCHKLEHERGALTPVLGLFVPHPPLHVSESLAKIPF